MFTRNHTYALARQGLNEDNTSTEAAQVVVVVDDYVYSACKRDLPTLIHYNPFIIHDCS